MMADAVGTVSGLPVSIQRPKQLSFLATQMAFPGETGPAIRFGDDAFLPNPEPSADDPTALLHESTMLGRLSSQGGFNANSHGTGVAGAMTAAWVGESGGAPGSDGATRAAGNGGVVHGSGDGNAGRPAGGFDSTASAAIVQDSGCTGRNPCTTPDLLFAAAPLPMSGPGKDQSTAPGSGKSRPDGTPPAAPQPDASDNAPPAKSSPVLVKDLPVTPDRDTLRLAAAELPAVAVPEPASFALLAIGVFFLLMLARRRHVQDRA